jgi:hypothetical protein
MFKKLLCAFFLFVSVLSFSQNSTLSKNSKVSIFTCGRGNELYTTFGHTAIRIKDEGINLDVVYNYGAFDFNTANVIVPSNFILNVDKFDFSSTISKPQPPNNLLFDNPSD